MKNQKSSPSFLAGGGVPFFPDSFLEWLIFFLVLVLLVLVAQQIFTTTEKEDHKKD